jgi:hypothetical protein
LSNELGTVKKTKDDIFFRLVFLTNPLSEPEPEPEQLSYFLRKLYSKLHEDDAAPLYSRK